MGLRSEEPCTLTSPHQLYRCTKVCLLLCIALCNYSAPLKILMRVSALLTVDITCTYNIHHLREETCRFAAAEKCFTVFWIVPLVW